MKDLKVRFFASKDGLEMAISALQGAGLTYEVFKFNEGAECYARQEVHEW